MVAEGEGRQYIINESSLTNPVSISKKSSNTVEFIAVLQEADAPNRNGRIYPKAVLEEGIKSPYIKEKLADGTLMGEVNHPTDNSVQRQMTIDLSNVSFRILEMWFEGNLLKGKCETLNNAKGRDMAGLIEQGCKLAFSLRAQGKVHQDPVSGAQMVEPGIQICTYDWVATPSHMNAKVLNICEETMMALCGKFGKGEMALNESAEFCMNGQLIDVDSASTLKETVDYVKYYNNKPKKMANMYLPESSDKVISIGLRETLIESANCIKRVLTEDYLLKDIREKLLKLSEEENSVDVVSDKEPDEADIDLDNKDIYCDDLEKEDSEEIKVSGTSVKSLQDGG